MKNFIAIIALLLIGASVNAQSIFKPMPKPYSVAHGNKLRLTTSLPDSTFLGFRFVASAVVQAYPGSIALAGLGFSYEHDTWNASTGNFYADYSVALLAYAGGSVAPTDLKAATAVGLNVSILNKRLSVGGAYNFLPASSNGSHWLLTIGTSFSIIN